MILRIPKPLAFCLAGTKIGGFVRMPNPNPQAGGRTCPQYGLRKGELLNLKWDHVNLRQSFLEILDQKNGNYDTIPLNQPTTSLLLSIARRIDFEYVFPGKIPGKPFWDLKRQFEKTVEDSKLKGVTFHVLRHTAVSDMVMSRTPLATVKEILRHKDYSMTLCYAHLSPSHKKAAMDLLGDTLKATAKKAEKTA